MLERLNFDELNITSTDDDILDETEAAGRTPLTLLTLLTLVTLVTLLTLVTQVTSRPTWTTS